MALLVSFFAPLLFFAVSALGTSILLKKKFGRVLPVVMVSVSVFMFLSQLLFHTFWVGFVLCLLYSVFALVAIIGFVKKSGLGAFKKKALSPGFIAFLVLYFIVAIYDFNRGFSAWDEFSHWGMMLKEMFRLDKFYFVEESNLLVHKDYPPALQLFELFWMRLCGAYSDNTALRAAHCFGLSLIVPFSAESLPKGVKNITKIFVSLCLCVFCMLFVLSLDLHGVMHTIYNDYIMALVVVFLCVSVFVDRKVSAFSVFSLSICGTFLLLLKQMGLPLYLIVLALFGGLVLIRSSFRIKQIINDYKLKNIILSFAILCVPFVFWLIWNMLTKNVAHQFDYSDLTITDFPNILLGSAGEAWQRFVIKKFLIALGSDSVVTLIIPITFIGTIVLALCGVWYLLKNHQKTYDKRELVFLGSLLCLSAACYSAAMLVLYVFSFGEYEGTRLASYERYMGTFSMIMLGIVALLIAMPRLNKGKYACVIIGTLVLFFTIIPTNYIRALPNPTGTGHNDISMLADKIKTVVPDGSKVFVVYQEPIGFYYYAQYFLTPISVNRTDYTWPVDGSVDPEDYYNKMVLPKMVDYDFLLIHNFDDEFLSNYCNVVCPKTNDSLYRVNKSSSSIEYDFVTSL